MTKLLLLRIGIMLMVLVSAACASNQKNAADLLRVGMDKAAALDKAGNPKRTYRTNSQDHWIYIHFRGNQEFSRTVTFEDSKIVKIGPAIPKTDWDREVESLKKGK